MSEQAYFVASAADSVFSSKQGIFEFNGFDLTVTFFQNLLERLSIEPQAVRAGRFKSAVEPFTREDLSPENEEQLASFLETLDDVFMSAIGESRQISPDSLRRIASERAIISASDAFDAGLLDGLLHHDEVNDIIKARLGVDADDDLHTIPMSRYHRISPSDAGLEVNRDGDVAIVYAVGQIVSGESDLSDPLGSGFLGAETFVDAMNEARESESVKAVVVRVDSPGGSASASDAMWRAIHLTSLEKPVVVSMGGLAASGGYWIATGAETVVADPLTITGSIGVFGLFFDASGFFEEKLGITFDGVQTSPYADMFSGIAPLSDGEREMLEAFVDDTYDDFLDRVAEARDMTTEEVDSVGQGRIWMGRRALEIGLIDTLGTLTDAVRVAARKAEMGEGPYRIRVLPRPKTFVEQLTSGLGARAVGAWTRLSTTPAERALLDQARHIRDAVRQQGSVQARLPIDITIR
jgi:protease-4